MDSSNTRSGLGNSAWDTGQLAATVKNRLKRIQYRPWLIGGFRAQTGLTVEPSWGSAPPRRLLYPGR
jgi:hypothetical protein